MKFRRIAAAVLIAVMAVSAMAAGASAYEYNAYMMFTDRDWNWGNWKEGKGGDAAITGPGTYTVSLDKSQADNTTVPANGANVFCIDIVGGAADLGEMEFTVDSIKADGNEVSFEAGNVIFGDLEEKGNYRIEIHNAYGGTKDKNVIDPAAFRASDKIEVTFTITDPHAVTEVTTVRETEPPETEPLPANAPEADISTKIVPTGNGRTLPMMGIMAAAAMISAAAMAAKKDENE